MNPAAGLLEGFAIVLIIACIVVGAITFGVTKLSQKTELVVKKPLVPTMRLHTDGKTVDTLYVYKINQ